MNKFYVTTPIYYPTARPHLGSLYSTVLADVSARFNKLQGKNVFFLTGTDEHGQKIAQSAQNVNKSPKDFVDQFIDAYKNTWSAYSIDYTKFIRTTDQAHVKAVQHWLSELIKKGDVYKDHYEGWYCVPCETFITEKDLIGTDAPLCPSCSRPTVKVTEESYFFKLSKYQDKLLEFYKNNPDFVAPKERLHEIINFVESGLRDLSISRTTVKWGIPFPGDEHHVTYVWADALNNYITAVGYPDDKKEFEYWWPADLQIMGKDILRFHAVYWPAFLMTSGLPLPKKLLAHGWIKINDQKMSKSFGNAVDPQDLLKNYGADQVRYYLLAQLSVAQDSNFSTQDLEEKINADLANNLGNLLNRVTQLASRYELLEIPKIEKWSDFSAELYQESKNTIKEFESLMNSYSYHMAMARVMHFVSKVNAYFHAQEPWKVIKSDRDKFIEIISAVMHSLEVIANLFWPIMPNKMPELLKQLSIDFDLNKNVLEELYKSHWNKSFKIAKGEILFEKIEQKEVAASSEQAAAVEKVEPNYIGIEDFAKVELLVGHILECVEVDGSDKLLKMQVDFGSKGKRQILYGVKKFFRPEDLINKQGVFVFNLKPRKMMGLESNGMMLTVTDADNNLKRVTVDGDVPAGSSLK